MSKTHFLKCSLLKVHDNESCLRFVYVNLFSVGTFRTFRRVTVNLGLPATHKEKNRRRRLSLVVDTESTAYFLKTPCILIRRVANFEVMAYAESRLVTF